MNPKSLLSRRPSASMVVALVALFAALGGVGYAATALPANSVGTQQLKNNAITFNKIAPHTIGSARINPNLVQTRVGGTCTGSKGAIGAVSKTGGVSCNSTVPNQFGSSATSVPIANTGTTTVTARTLPSGSNYLMLANPTALITSASGTAHTTVTCTLSDGSANQTRSIIFPTGASGTQQEQSLPLQLAGGAGTAKLACSTSTPGVPPTVAVTGAINAIQTGSNS
ncbi:MAG: hypothetical protein QOH87_4800 [Trebonia sp.]|jgi:hypothetical protein|nr:hypothetical protein [Trebonia sp.]